jgi:hypothetical protein
VSKVNDELDSFLENLSHIGRDAISATTEVIDEESTLLFENIKASTPVRTGGLKNSLVKRRKTDNHARYGYIIEYAGYNEQGVPYSKIARTLNKGTKTVSATRHIDRAIRKLKGLDDRIYERYLEKIKRR